jgi:hypothetical protein
MDSDQAAPARREAQPIRLSRLPARPPQATRQILSMLVPPGAPIGSPQVMA